MGNGESSEYKRFLTLRERNAHTNYGSAQGENGVTFT
jgi:hypothetical protein